MRLTVRPVPVAMAQPKRPGLTLLRRGVKARVPIHPGASPSLDSLGAGLFVPKPSTRRDCQCRSTPVLGNKSSVDVAGIPPLRVVIITHLVRGQLALQLIDEVDVPMNDFLAPT
jgi:hypothetical protein